MKKILILVLICLSGLLSNAQSNNILWFNSYGGIFDPKITISVIVENNSLSLTYTTENGHPSGYAQILFTEAGGTCNTIPTYSNYTKLGGLAMDVTQTLTYNYTTDFAPGVQYTGIGAIITPIDTIWSNAVCFVTGSSLTKPSLSTTIASSITSISASSGGFSISDGGSSITGKGVRYGTNPTLETFSSTSDGIGSSDFTSTLTGLTPNTLYYYKTWAVNVAGFGFGSTLSFTTLTESVSAPTVTTNSVTAITYTTADINCSITSDGGSVVTSYGIYYRRSDIGTYTLVSVSGSTTNFTINLTGLTQGSTYYVYAFALNSVGYGYGSNLSFNTPTEGGTVPTVATLASITNITTTSATGGGTVTSEGSSPVTMRGIQVSIASNFSSIILTTSDGSGTGNFTSSITGLTHSTQYYVRAYAINSAGTGYGAIVAFTTPAPSTVSATLSSLFASETSSTISIYWGVSLASAATSPVSFTVNVTNSTNTGTTPITINFKIGEQTSYSNSITYNKQTSAYTAYATFGTMPSGYSAGNSASYQIPAVSTTIPTVTTASISAITENSAISGGNVTSDGGLTVLQRGVQVSLYEDFRSIFSSTSDGSEIGSFTSNIQNLPSGTTFYVRAYATNTNGMGRGGVVSFTTINAAILCDVPQSYPGGRSYPTTIQVNLGSDAGTVSLTYDPETVPDRFVVSGISSFTTDTGYRGDSRYDYGGTRRYIFTDALNGKAIPYVGGTYPNFVLHPDDGYPRILGSNSPISITKLEGHNIATIEVYAPVENTVWSFSLSCPN